MKKTILALSLLFSSNLFAEESMPILWNNLAPGPAELPVATNINKELEGKNVIIPGFVVPLDGKKGVTRHFLLTPQQGACFHKPPSPENQLIHVEFDTAIAIPDPQQPIYISGTLSVKSKQTGFAKTGYYIKGIEAVAYPVQNLASKTPSDEEQHQH